MPMMSWKIAASAQKMAAKPKARTLLLFVFKMCGDGYAGLDEGQPEQGQGEQSALHAGVAHLDAQVVQDILAGRSRKLFERFAHHLLGEHGGRRLADGAASPGE